MKQAFSRLHLLSILWLIVVISAILAYYANWPTGMASFLTTTTIIILLRLITWRRDGASWRLIASVFLFSALLIGILIGWILLIE